MEEHPHEAAAMEKTPDIVEKLIAESMVASHGRLPSCSRGVNALVGSEGRH